MRRNVLAIAVLAGLCWSASAEAVPITATYDFTGKFASGPYPTVTGSLTMSYDTSGTVDNGLVTSFSSNLPSDHTPIYFVYNKGDVTFGQHLSPSGGYAIYSPEDDLAGVFEVSTTGSVTGSSQLAYATIFSNEYISSSFGVTEVSTTYVPEPASIAVLGMGLIGLAVVLRRRRV